MVNLVDESLKFMVLGMGIVFLLLILIVVLTYLQSYIVNRYFPDREIEPVASEATLSGSSEIDDDIVAAITIAVSRYKSDRR